MANITLASILAMPDGPTKRMWLNEYQRQSPTAAFSDVAVELPDARTSVEVSVVIELSTQTECSTNEHFRRKMIRAKKQRKTVADVLNRMVAVLPSLPVVVQLTRISAGTLDEHDNLPSAFKHVADAIAEDVYRVKDNDPRITWCRPRQIKAPSGQQKIRITISRRDFNAKTACEV